MLDIFLGKPDALLVISAICILIALWFLQLLLKVETGHTWPVWMVMALVALYLLWHRGTWLASWIVDVVQARL